MAQVLAVANGRVTFQLEDGKKLELGQGDPQLRHLDHAWASTVHAFQGRTVDNVIAAMEARLPHLTTQKAFTRISHQDLVVFRFSSYNQCISADSDGL